MSVVPEMGTQTPTLPLQHRFTELGHTAILVPRLSREPGEPGIGVDKPEAELSYAASRSLSGSVMVRHLGMHVHLFLAFHPICGVTIRRSIHPLYCAVGVV